MNRNRHESKKQELLNSAFRIWGKSHFRSCSLSELAADNDMTKQALYRYFPSKGKLEMAMEEEAAAMYVGHTRELLRQLEQAPAEDFASIYMNQGRQFIEAHPFRFDYMSHRFRWDTIPEFSRDLLWRLYRLAGEKAAIPPAGIRYLNALMLGSIHCDKTPGSFQWQQAWEEGFAAKNLNRLPDFERLLTDAGRIDMSRFDDPLLNAVFTTVMEEAGGNVSLSKVARRAGLCKSSLYNYWPSKQAMFDDVLGRQAVIYGTLFSEFVENYSHPADVIFAYPAFTGTFFLRSPDVLNYIQRLTTLAGMPLQKGSEAALLFMAPLNSLVEKGSIIPGDYTNEEILALTGMTTVMEIQHHLTVHSVRIHIEQGLKDIYRLVSGGIQALRRTM